MKSACPAPGRLHDLFVTHEAMSPGEWKTGGEGLTVFFGFHPSPFGSALVMATRARPCRPRLRRSRRGTRRTCGYEGALAARRLRRGQRPHRGHRQAHFRFLAMAAEQPTARGADRHRLGSAGVGNAAANPHGPRSPPIRISPARSTNPPPRAPSAPQSARTRCRSWCRAIASSASRAISPAITGASPASAPCSAGRRGRSGPRRNSQY